MKARSMSVLFTRFLVYSNYVSVPRINDLEDCKSLAQGWTSLMTMTSYVIFAIDVQS